MTGVAKERGVAIWNIVGAIDKGKRLDPPTEICSSSRPQTFLLFAGEQLHQMVGGGLGTPSAALADHWAGGHFRGPASVSSTASTRPGQPAGHMSGQSDTIDQTLLFCHLDRSGRFYQHSHRHPPIGCRPLTPADSWADTVHHPASTFRTPPTSPIAAQCTTPTRGA